MSLGAVTLPAFGDQLTLLAATSDCLTMPDTLEPGILTI